MAAGWLWGGGAVTAKRNARSDRLQYRFTDKLQRWINLKVSLLKITCYPGPVVRLQFLNIAPSLIPRNSTKEVPTSGGYPIGWNTLVSIADHRVSSNPA